MKSELSPAAMAVAIEESHVELNQVMGRSPLVELHDSAAMLTVLTRVAHPGIWMPNEIPPPSPIGVLLILWLLIGCVILSLFRWIRHRWREAARSRAMERWETDTVERGRGLILVADDELHIIRLVEINLQRAGYAAITTTDWEEVLPMARAARPEVIVLDIRMPRRASRADEHEETGCELVKAIRADPSLSGIPVILLTTRSARAVDDSRCPDLPPDAATYLYKPFNPAELLSLIKELIRTENRSS